jgi:DNA-binding NarL/FixJ family response regulator
METWIQPDPFVQSEAVERIGRRVTHSSTAKSVLTPRELEVLRMLADGLTTKAIAVEAHVTFKTAACHRSRILQKLGVDCTVSAVRWAIREGIIQA